MAYRLNVRLTPQGKETAIRVAKAFRANNISVGSAELGRLDRDGYELHLDGIAGEICFCRLFGLVPDLRVGSHSRADATFPDGTTVDVKTMTFPNADLLVMPGKKEKRCDLYAMMVGRFPEYRFAGVATQETVFRTENYRKYPANHWNYVVLKEHLYIPWDRLSEQ